MQERSRQVERTVQVAAGTASSKSIDSAIPMTFKMAYWLLYAAKYYTGGAIFDRSRQALRRRVLTASANIVGEEQPVAELDADSDPDVFRRRYLYLNRPVVIRGLLSDAPAASWTPDFFRRQYGDTKVHIRRRGDRANMTEHNPIDQVTMAELVDNIEQNGAFFGSALEEIFNEHPELRSQVDIEKLGRYAGFGSLGRFHSMQLFMSGQAARTGFHCAAGINLFVQLYGRKRWTFVDPRYGIWMSPAAREDMLLVVSPITTHRVALGESAEERALYKAVPKQCVISNPGDVLLSPQWWWHAVENEDITIAAAVRTIRRLFAGHWGLSLLNYLSRDFWRTALDAAKNGGWAKSDVDYRVERHNAG